MQIVQNIERASHALERPVLAVDVVVLCLRGGSAAVLLQRRTEAPFEGAWALPGVAVRAEETLLEAAGRALAEKASLEAAEVQRIHLEQLVTQDGLYRDPRGRTVSVVYLGLVRDAPLLEPERAVWRPVSEIGLHDLPFDHSETVTAALGRLKGKLRYTNIAACLLPATFRIEELEAVYRAVLGRPLYRANLRSKLLKIGLIERARVASEAVGLRGGRPPHLYRFRRSLLAAEDRDFI